MAKVASFETREWIDPWRDRRPMTEDAVLATYFYNGKGYVDTAFYSKGGGGTTNAFIPEGWSSPGIVLAWMPLPDPYNPVEEVE